MARTADMDFDESGAAARRRAGPPPPPRRAGRHAGGTPSFRTVHRSAGLGEGRILL